MLLILLSLVLIVCGNDKKDCHFSLNVFDSVNFAALKQYANQWIQYANP